jgi:hypothetical protein
LTSAAAPAKAKGRHLRGALLTILTPLSRRNKGRDGGAGGALGRLKILNGRRERTDNCRRDRVLDLWLGRASGRGRPAIRDQEQTVNAE